MIPIHVAETLYHLDQEMSKVIGAAWSESTLSTRNSQRGHYLKFCGDHGLVSLPADPHTVARFLIWQSSTSKYSTCNNYLSAINVLHKFYGFDIDYRECFLIKLIMKGLKSILGDHVKQKRPFTVQELESMFDHLDFHSDREMLCWTVIILSFRTLLRKSNLVPSSHSDFTHVIQRKDVSFHSWGMMISVGSTKTLRHSEYTLQIPVHYVSNKALCAASAVRYHMDNVPAPENGPLFVVREPSGPLLYHTVLSHIKLCASRIGIKAEDVGCHSLRRSGAAHMHSIGIPLIDIMSIGDWKSTCVLQYLVTRVDRKQDIQKVVANSLSI